MTMKSRGVLIAGNWKMNHGLKATEDFFGALKASPFAREGQAAFAGGALRAAVFPPMLSLVTARALSQLNPFPIHVGAQNVHWEKSGAFTGEISGPMLSELVISWALVGHSERRQYFGETDETVRKRTESLLAQGFTVVLCIGETRAERESGRTAEVLTRQLQGAIPEAGKGAAPFLDGRLIIAYEPVWAIGTGLTATPQQAEEAHQQIRKLLWDRFGMDASGRTPILYGGSVTPENIDTLLACPNVDGALVGGASLKPESFTALLQGGARAVAAK
jgi:triosephosphate isomerase